MNYLNPNVIWLNADEVRKKYNDWDFSHEGRLRQSTRMKELADKAQTKYVIADFVCPLPEMREIYDPHFIIWLDTISQGRFEDTNRVFVVPDYYNVRVTEQDAGRWAKEIYQQMSRL
jgi:adenylylsulfate kinase